MEYTPDGKMLDIREDKKKQELFLNPVRKDVRKFALSIVREIVRNYDVDAYALDYCRYPGDDSDFSADSRKAFEHYLGKKSGTFQTIFSLGMLMERKNPGIYYKEWWAFRLMLSLVLCKEVRKEIHSYQ
ncbi:hypothetical protein NXV13_30215 [Bacteroides ovatus]|nr:hypothetical protein [Bacteroides ovatus]